MAYINGLWEVIVLIFVIRAFCSSTGIGDILGSHSSALPGSVLRPSHWMPLNDTRRIRTLYPKYPLSASYCRGRFSDFSTPHLPHAATGAT